MSDERLAQARDEAERAAADAGITYRSRFVSAAFRDGVEQGVRWADANPQPRTIALSQSEAIPEAGRTGRYEDHEAALRAAGIEVEEDDE